MQNIFIDILPPWVETGLQPAFYDLESGTVLQQTARMYAKVRELTEAFNTFTENVTNEVNTFEQNTNDEIERFEGVVNGVVEEYIEKFNELHDYVEDYFDNLDVQEEINNKLDAMVEDGTFERILDEHFKVQVIFPKNAGEVNSGDCFLVKTPNKSILFDTHAAAAKDAVEDFLDRNNVEVIDYVILTHYHADHIGNVVNLINDGYITADTTVYLPGYSSLIADSPAIYNDYMSVNNALYALHCTTVQPTEGMEVEIDNVSFKFYNCTTDVFTEEGYTAYNDCSTVVELTYGSKKALFTGDIEVKPFERFERLKMFNYKIDLYKIEHHGINYTAKILPFFDRISPSYAVQTAELADFSSGAIAQGATTIYLKDKNCKLYSVYDNESDIKFRMCNYNVLCTSGVENYSASNRTPDIDIYVDPSVTSSIRDGSQSNPYKYLPEAYARIPMNEHTNFNIHLADGVYEDSGQSSVLGKVGGATRIKVIGNTSDNTAVTIKHSCIVKNKAFVTFDSITFEDQIAYVENATLYIKNCVASKQTQEGNFVYCEGDSTVKLESSSFDNTSIGVSAHSDRVIAYNCTFSNMTTAIQCSNTGTVHEKSNTFTDVTNKVVLYDGSIDVSHIPVAELLWSGEVNDLNTDLNLAHPLSRYNILLVTLGYNGNNPNSATVYITYQDIAKFYKNSYLMGSYNYSSAGNATAGMVRLAIGNDLSKIQVTKQDGIKVRKIVGIDLPIL